jgi:hypothetical protein
MGQKTYDPQTAKFIATVVQNMPDVSDMQRWIEDPKSLRAALSSTFCSNGKGLTTHATRPAAYNGWEVDTHVDDGLSDWDVSKIHLYLDPSQEGSKRIEGNKLHRIVATKNPLNARSLERIMQGTDAEIAARIAAIEAATGENWKVDANGKTRYIFFHGTTYRGSSGGRRVRCLSWYGGRWVAHCNWLGYGWFSQNPSAVRAS